MLASDLTGYNRYWGAVAAANVSAYNGSTNIFNLLTYGGVGDDTTDNSIAISNWLNAATLAKGRAYFPAGIYRFTNAALINDGGHGSINAMICGDGRFTSMFDPETNGLSSWNTNWSTPAAFEIITNGDIVFSDCGFYGGLFTGNLVYDQNARITWNNVGVCKNGGAPLNALVCGGLGYGTGGTNLSYQFGDISQ